MRRKSGWSRIADSFCVRRSKLRTGGSRRSHILEMLEDRQLMSADVSVAIKAPATVLGGDMLAYDITVTNHGPDSAQDVLLTDVLPADTTFVESHNLTPGVPLQITQPNASQHGSVIIEHLPGTGLIAAETSFEIELTVRVAPDANNAGAITNSVHVATDGIDPVPDNDSASVTTTVQPPTVFISGHVYFDANADGVRQPATESPLGQSVFVDLNDNGMLDPNEPVSQPDPLGEYQFALASAGTYIVRVVPTPSAGFVGTTPEGGSYTVAAPAGSSFTNLDFGETQNSPTIPTVSVANRFAPASDANTAFVTGVYRNVLERTPDPSGMAHWTTMLAAGMSRATVASDLWNSLEHRGLEVDHFYETYLHRAADAAGRNYWAMVLVATGDENSVIAALLSGAEYRAQHTSNHDFVMALYDDVLMRSADPDGVKHWEGALQQGASRTLIAEYFLNSFICNQYVAESLYANYLHRQGDPNGIQAIINGLGSGSHLAGEYAVEVLASDEYFAQAAASVTP